MMKQNLQDIPFYSVIQKVRLEVFNYATETQETGNVRENVDYFSNNKMNWFTRLTQTLALFFNFITHGRFTILQALEH